MPDSFQLPDFYPRPPRGGRRDLLALSNSADLFLSTPSARRATRWILLRLRCSRISIHALREEGDHLRVLQAQDQTISIHALREEGDQDHRQVGSSDFISIHALREEGDDSTVGVGRQVEISIHALREEGDHPPRRSSRRKPISIHALREEGDVRQAATMPCPAYFYPRPPRGGRPCGRPWKPRRHTHFYPRPPRGGRLFRDGVILSLHIFLSTPSARRATYVAGYVTKKTYISIHALREEGDTSLSHLFLTSTDFYPRPPRGGRLLS